MEEIKISKSDIAAVAAWIKEHSLQIRNISIDSRSPAIKVIDSVLQINRKYCGFVVPRLESFMKNHPEIQRVVELKKLMENYPTSHAFMQNELNFNYEDRAKILESVVEYVCSIVDGTQTVSEEEKLLKQWAIKSRPQDHHKLNIKGFGYASFQYLRMLFGVQTAKPDRHIIRFLFERLGKYVSQSEAHYMLDRASKVVGISVRDVDAYIWKIGARKKK